MSECESEVGMWPARSVGRDFGRARARFFAFWGPKIALFYRFFVKNAKNFPALRADKRRRRGHPR